MCQESTTEEKMSTHRAHAHARTNLTDQLADAWSAERYPDRGGNWTVQEAEREAFAAGMVAAGRPFGLGWDGVELLAEAGRLFRTYEAHHRAKVDQHRDKPDRASRIAAEESEEKAERNADIAQRIEDHLAEKIEREDLLCHLDELGKIHGLALTLVQDIEDLIGDSAGVAGLHRNGDVATWYELTEGPFAAWLGSYPRLKEAIDALGDVPGRAMINSIAETNPAEVLRDAAERMVDGEAIKGVDHAAFDRAAAHLEEPMVTDSVQAGRIVRRMILRGDGGSPFEASPCRYPAVEGLECAGPPAFTTSPRAVDLTGGIDLTMIGGRDG